MEEFLPKPVLMRRTDVGYEYLFNSMADAEKFSSQFNVVQITQLPNNFWQVKILIGAPDEHNKI